VAKAGKDSKKPGKLEVLITKDVKKSLSGIESLVTLLDYKLQSLPFEKLRVFKEIGARSRDTSLFCKLTFNLNKLIVLAKRY